MAELIFEDESLVIRSQPTASDDMVSLIARTVWGSGGTRYQLRDAQAKAELLKGSHFIGLYIGGRLAGVYVLRRKQVTIGKGRYDAYYRTFLALEPERRGRGYGTLLVANTRRHFLTELSGKGLLYGYIEAGNAVSLRVSKRAGYRPVASFCTQAFSRLRPRPHPAVRPLGADRASVAVAQLNALYAKHQLRDFHQSLDPDRYLVLEDDTGIVAGVQIELCDWMITHLPGLQGFLLVHLVSRTPFLRRVFDARRCRFLKFGNLYARPGCEFHLFTLMESALAYHRVGSAIIFYDPRSPVFQRIAAAGNFGVLQSGVGARVHITASWLGLSTTDAKQLEEKPVVLSPLDIG